VLTFIAVVFAYLLFPLPVPLFNVLITGILVAVVVSAVELVCVSWVDNVAIPLVSAFLIWWLVAPFL
jgi:dolichol kinase